MELWNRILLTMDLDWAPDYILKDVGSLLSGTSVPVTFFCTHRSAGVDELLSHPIHEGALHPNFLQPPHREEEALKELFRLFPGPRGIRNHVLFFHSRLLPIFHRHNIRYFSNDLCFLEPGLRPSFDWSGLVRVPIFWEDDVHLHFFGPSPSPSDLRLDRPGLKVLSFHPVHIFLNTTDFSEYECAKEHFRDARKLLRHRHSGNGIRELFESALKVLSGVESSTMAEVAQVFRRTETYQGRFGLEPRTQNERST